MELQELFDIYASGQTYMESGGPDLYERHRQGMVSRMSSAAAHYLFTVGPPGNEWDVIELDNEVTVKLFTKELTYESLNLPPNNNSAAPLKPTLRFLVLYPVTEQEEALKMMGQPFIDHYVALAVLLSDDDTYVPVGAVWVGRPAADEDGRRVRQIIHQVSTELDKDLDRSSIQPAPPIDVHTIELMAAFKDHELSPQERERLVRALENLPDASFMEALGRLMPMAWTKNEWIATERSLAERAQELKNRMSTSDQKSIRRAPWKTAWCLPAPFHPKLIIKASKHGSTSEPLL